MGFLDSDPLPIRGQRREEPEQDSTWYNPSTWFDWDWSADESPQISQHFANPITPEHRREQAADPYAALTPLEGFLGSTLSSIPELFGFDAPKDVQRWRDEHPVGDLTSQLAGIAIPYGGWAGATAKVPKIASTLTKATEGTLKAFGTTAARSPVVGGALKEFYRFTPLELSRLGTGWSVDADMGNMFQDVALSQVLTGALGGVGGFLKAGGKAAGKLARIAEAPEEMLDALRLRIGRDPNSNILNIPDGTTREDFLADLQKTALQAWPESAEGKLKGRNVYNLQWGTPETEGFIESLFKPNKARATAEEIEAGPLDIRLFHPDSTSKSLNAAEALDSANLAGFAGGVDELAENLIHPRVVRITMSEGEQGGKRMAGQFGKKMEDMIENGALKQVDEDTWMGQEDGGLWFVIKRIERGPEMAPEVVVAPVPKAVAKETPEVAAASEFDSWFSGSKVVDESGQPLKVYHGTTADFAEFKADPRGGTQAAIYFSPVESKAGRYAGITPRNKAGRPGARVVPAYLSLKNPKIIGEGQLASDMKRARKMDTSSFVLSPADVKKLVAEGHDGVINLTAREVAVFDPAQIRLAKAGDAERVAAKAARPATPASAWELRGSGARPRKPKFQHGPAQVRAGDRFVVGKTDKIDLFAKDAHKINQSTIASWARYKDPIRQMAGSDRWTKESNLIQGMLDPQDWEAFRTLRRKDAMYQVVPKLAKRVKNSLGIADLEYTQQLANKLYNIVAPKAFKMGKNPTYGRLQTMLEGTMKYSDSVLHDTMKGRAEVGGSMFGALRGKDVKFLPVDGFRPIDDIVHELRPDDELQQLMVVSQGQFPANKLKEMVAEGLLTPKVVRAAEELATINRHVLDTYVLPALQKAGREEEFKWLDGYIFPRMFQGDSFVQIVDAASNSKVPKPKYIAAGFNNKEAQDLANTIIAEAALDGKTWKALPVESRVFKGTAGEPDNLEEIYKMVHEQMGQSGDAQEIVQRAMRKLLATKQAQPVPGRRLPASQTPRTGIPGSGDTKYHTPKDVLKSVENHYRNLLRYSGFHHWNYRYGSMAAKWGKEQATEYTDLMRNATQWLGVEGQLTNTLNKLLTPLLGHAMGGKPATRIAQATNSMMYDWNLGILNPTFAVLNLLGPLQTTAPWIAMMQRLPSEEAARVMQQQLVFDEAGRVAGNVKMLNPIKVIGRAIGLAAKPPPDLLVHLNRALADGSLGAQLQDHFIGQNAKSIHSLKAAAGESGWEFIKETLRIMSTRSEQFSRLISFNSAYILGKDFFKLEGDALYRFMRKGTETTMYGYSVMDRSRVLTGPIGSMWGLFKNWQFHFIGQMAQYAGLAMKDGIYAPMLWQGASALALGGIGATPLVMLADGLAKLSSDSPDAYAWLQDNWQSPFADGVYYGFPSTLGITLQSSSMMPGTDITQDIEAMSNAVLWQRAKAAWKGISGAASIWEGTGANPLRDPNVVDQLMYAFSPRAVFRAYGAMEGDYIRSMATGYPTVRDLPIGVKVLHAAGFNSTEIDKHYIVGERFHETRERKRDAIRDLGEAYAQAYLARDGDAMDSAIRRAYHSGVDVNSVLDSADTRLKREQYGDHLSQYGTAAEAEAGRLGIF